MRSLRRAALLCCCMLVFGSSNVIVYDNLSGAISSVDSASDDGPLYNSFNSGTSGFGLADVMVSLTNAVPGGTSQFSAKQAKPWAPGHRPSATRPASQRANPKLQIGPASITVALYGDNAGSPGALLMTLGTLNDTALTSSPANYDFPLSTPFSLTPNTRYWLGISTANGSQAFWNWSLDVTGVGVAGQFFANAGGVSPSGNGPYQMRVTVGAAVAPPPATPAPSSLILTLTGVLGIGLYFVRRKYLQAC